MYVTSVATESGRSALCPLQTDEPVSSSVQTDSASFLVPSEHGDSNESRVNDNPDTVFFSIQR